LAAVARVVLVTAKLNEDDDDARVVVRAKSNIGPDGGKFRYELHQVELRQKFPGSSASRVEWGEPIEGEVREVLATAERGRGRRREQRQGIPALPARGRPDARIATLPR
jgi:hypothetical protein